MNDALITVGGTLLGVVIGFGLNTWQNQAHQRQVDRGVRLLLRLECEQNLKSLGDYWWLVTATQYQGAYGVGTTQDDEDFHILMRLALIPLPARQRLMWESQAGLLASALKPEVVRQAAKMYNDLELFALTRTQAKEVMEQPEGRQLQGEFAAWMADRRQKTQTPEMNVKTYSAIHAFVVKHGHYSNECRAIYNRLQVGNPISEESPVMALWQNSWSWVGSHMPFQRKEKKLAGL